MSTLHVLYPGLRAPQVSAIRAVIRRGLRLARRTQQRGYPLGNLRSNILKAFKHRQRMPLGPTVGLVENLTGLALRAGVDTRVW